MSCILSIPREAQPISISWNACSGCSYIALHLVLPSRRTARMFNSPRFGNAQTHFNVKLRTKSSCTSLGSRGRIEFMYFISVHHNPLWMPNISVQGPWAHIICHSRKLVWHGRRFTWSISLYTILSSQLPRRRNLKRKLTSSRRQISSLHIGLTHDELPKEL